MSEARKRKLPQTRPSLALFIPDDGEDDDVACDLSASMTLPEFYEAYVLPVCRVAAGRDKKTVLLEKTAMRFWRKLSGNPPLHSIDENTMATFVNQYRQCPGKYGELVSPNSVRKQCRMIQHILDHAGPKTRRRRNAKSLIPEPPCFPLVEAVETKRPALTLDEIARWWDASDRPSRPSNLTPTQRRKWWRALITFAYNTALRIDTVVQLEKTMLGADGWLSVPARILKGHRRDWEFYCNEQARSAIESIWHFGSSLIFPWHTGDKPAKPDALQDERKKAWEAAGIQRKHNGFHGMRRACLDWVGCRNVIAARFIAGHAAAGDVLQGHYMNPRTIVPEYLDILPQPVRSTADKDQMLLPGF